jgi:predicted glycogen debranching enzyme
MKIVRLTPYASMPSLFFVGEKMEYYPAPRWNYNVEYQEEQQRGFDYQEDLFCPGFIEKILKPGDSFYVSVSTKKNLSDNLAEVWRKEEVKREEDRKNGASLPNSPYASEWQELAYSSRHFLVKNRIHGEAVIAGYPWFVEWGRDSMIALPGLTFSIGKIDFGIKVLKTFIAKEQNGLLPNYLPNGYGHQPAYNSVDASLWFFWALQELLNATQDREMIKKSFGLIMSKIIEAYVEEKIPDVYLKSNGLIWAGNEQTQLTWMDARAYGKPVTPRYGYAVEINALWYNALGFYLSTMGHEGIDEETHANLTYIHEIAGRSFKQIFWSEEKKYLADFVNNEGADFSLRPNQIFSASLHFSPLDHNQKREIVAAVKEKLLTPYGLRTLSPESKAFRPYYEGGSDERDYAYHQGTVWPWLLGHFIEAYIKVNSDKQNLESLEEFLRPLIMNHLYDHGLLSVSEIFDGERPHRPNGCFAQAWSVAEVLRGFKLIQQAKEQITKKNGIS